MFPGIRRAFSASLGAFELVPVGFSASVRFRRTNGDRRRSVQQFDLKWIQIGLKLSLLQPSEWA